MATFRVYSGLQKALKLPEAQVVLFGRHKWLKSLVFEGTLAEKLGPIDEKLFVTALKQLQHESTVPLYLDLAKIVSVKDDVSRANTPSNSIKIFKELKSLKIGHGIKQLNLVLFAEYDHVLASVSAAARSFSLYSRKTKKNDLESIHLEVVVTDGKSLTDADVKFLQGLSDALRICARQIDSPANELHSEVYADEAIQLVDGLNAGVTKLLIKGEDLKKQGFGGIYHVGKAARNPPIFLCFSHKPKQSTESYALVGKGIIFDTGGMQIKGKTAMPSMKVDMGGSAAVLAAFCALVNGGFKEELHCLLCIAENSISPDANKPDDVITLLSGKTVEISNTDAEGRLVLADGVYYAKNTLHAKNILDMATLTSAQAFATGRLISAVLCNNEEAEKEAMLAGKKSGDLVHPLPYGPDLHFSDLNSQIADMKNSNLGTMEGPPSAIAGLFIASHVNFAADFNWTHVDIASPAFTNDRATGFGPTFICALLSKHLDANVAKQS